jgi:hypothetical protein
MASSASPSSSIDVTRLRVTPWLDPTVEVEVPTTLFENEDELELAQLEYDMKCQAWVRVREKRREVEEKRRKEKEEAERKAREEVERRAREEAERLAREEAERKAKEEAEAEARRQQVAREQEAIRKLEEARAEERRLAEEQAKLAAELESQMDVEVEASEVERLAIGPRLEEAERVANRMSRGRSETVRLEVDRSLTAANNELVASVSREQATLGKRKRAQEKGKEKSSVSDSLKLVPFG